MDNTVFHKGFPINYRQNGGTPSIQFSLSTDKTRADIDVAVAITGILGRN